MVPDLFQNTLLSSIKLPDAYYISIYDGDEVNIYDGRTTRIRVSEKAVLKGWRCTATKLWWIPLRAQLTNVNEDTLVFTSKDGKQSLNSLYEVPTIKHVIDHVQAIMTSDWPSESIHNVYKLPIIGPVILYLHAAVSFPTKSTWLKSISRVNYLVCPLVTVKNVTKYFPESEETQQGHMKWQRQVIRSTRHTDPPAE